MKTVEERFWAKVNKDGPIPPHRPELGKCWVWTASKYQNGYGQFSIGRKAIFAHRLSFEIAHGQIAPGWCVCHACDNKPCVNPGHLWLGSYADNMRDASAKGRMATGDRNGSNIHPERRPVGDRNGSRLHPEKLHRGDDHWQRKNPEKRMAGELNGNAALTGDRVRLMRQQYASGEFSQRALARMHDTSQTNVGFIVRGTAWAHVA